MSRSNSRRSKASSISTRTPYWIAASSARRTSLATNLSSGYRWRRAEATGCRTSSEWLTQVTTLRPTRGEVSSVPGTTIGVTENEEPQVAPTPSHNPLALVRAGLDKALQINGQIVQAHVARIRRSHPDAPPAKIIKALEKQFLAAVAALGGGAGAAAAAPGVGTGAAVLINLAEVGSFLEAGVLFSLAVADVHGVQVHDIERRRTLVMAVLMGSNAASAVERIAGRTGRYWAKGLVSAIPMSAINRINGVLGPRFVTKYGTKQGILVLGRELPFGIGAAIGAGGNIALGKLAISGARRAFGPPPSEWPGSEPPGTTSVLRSA